ncbi:MAG: hypothetical protein GVY23_07475 [Spirochaetes bacterium]|jgi:hypothetical protein|nr:hypothetical protein [Spirochaetota bacterium]
MHLGKTYRELKDIWAVRAADERRPYEQGQRPFAVNLLPEDALEEPLELLMRTLRARFGDAVEAALSVEYSDPTNPIDGLPDELRGPSAGRTDNKWLHHTNMVGVNVRTIGSFLSVVKYAMTLPPAQGAIHLLPVWEPGVVGSLYGISSFNINGEFSSDELTEAFSHLAGPQRQLRAVINLLHVMGFAVGMDVIPHTDRFSQVVLAHPQHFEWLRREDLRIVDHRADLHTEVQERIIDFLDLYGPAAGVGRIPRGVELFAPDFDEERRNRILFGEVADKEARDRRRGELARHIYRHGYEPVPATMAPPYRGIEVDPDTRYEDADGHIWRDYRITQPQSMSRVFGPLARYKLYERVDDNRDWRIDFSRPREEVWAYVCRRYAEMQQSFGFDFMRGDMSHVQMRPEGVPAEIDERYDLLKAVRGYIRRHNNAPYFGYFAETFISPRGIMAYGDEIDHLEACDAEVTLGDLQSVPVGSEDFIRRLRWYRDIAEQRHVVPSFTIMTGDKDDPRFDSFYVAGNELRLFMGLFLTDMPSYMALGFECRDVHNSPAPNEHYTKLYVFQETDGPKATSGPYRFGRNGNLFYNLTRIRLFAEAILPELTGAPSRFLVPPDATASQAFFAWTQADEPRYLFVGNADTSVPVGNFNIPAGRVLPPGATLSPVFSTVEGLTEDELAAPGNGRVFKVHRLEPGEGRAYRIA